MLALLVSRGSLANQRDDGSREQGKRIPRFRVDFSGPVPLNPRSQAVVVSNPSLILQAQQRLLERGGKGEGGAVGRGNEGTEQVRPNEPGINNK